MKEKTEKDLEAYLRARLAKTELEVERLPDRDTYRVWLGNQFFDIDGYYACRKMALDGVDIPPWQRWRFTRADVKAAEIKGMMELVEMIPWLYKKFWDNMPSLPLEMSDLMVRENRDQVRDTILASIHQFKDEPVPPDFHPTAISMVWPALKTHQPPAPKECDCGGPAGHVPNGQFCRKPSGT